MFFVLKGNLNIEFKDKTINLSENEFVVIPKGVEHKPVADNEVMIMLIEPDTTINTGEVINEFTKINLEKF